MSTPVKQRQRTIYVRDTYRLRRGYGFRMHYTEKQCSRKATHGDFCYQHSPATSAERLKRSQDRLWRNRR